MCVTGRNKNVPHQKNDLGAKNTISTSTKKRLSGELHSPPVPKTTDSAGTTDAPGKRVALFQRARHRAQSKHETADKAGESDTRSKLKNTTKRKTVKRSP